MSVTGMTVRSMKTNYAIETCITKIDGANFLKKQQKCFCLIRFRKHLLEISLYLYIIFVRHLRLNKFTLLIY